MNNQYDKDLKKKFASYAPAYDDASIWSEIDRALEEKPKKKRSLIWFFVGSVIIGGLMTAWFSLSEDPTISIIDGNCSGNDLYVDGAPLTALDDCSYETPLVMSGNTYSLAAVNNSSADLSGISTIDLVILQRGLLYGFDDNASIYKADYDHDGAVSTYDIVKLRSDILGITTQANYHVIPTDFDIPTLDPFDIQVNYSSLEFTTDDYTQNLMTVKILKLGDLR